MARSNVLPSKTTILNKIGQCTECPLHNNQRPLLDNKSVADIFWVGLSAVKVGCTKKEQPLSDSTNSGKLIASIENKNKAVGFYKTNLVKCLPLNEGKIRYPKKEEMSACDKHLHTEIDQIQPKLVFLLGKQVGDFVTERKDLKFSEEFNYEPFQKGNTLYVPVHHPSYILVYKRKQLDSYVNGITKIIKRFMKNATPTAPIS
jgi:uracil-DNA glycosylase family 4